MAACVGVARNSDIFPCQSDVDKFYESKNCILIYDRGYLKIFKYKGDSGKPKTFVLTSHPTHPIHLTYAGMNAPSADQREKAASSIDVLKVIFETVLRRDSSTDEFKSAAAAHVVQKFVVNNWHLHPNNATLIALCLCILVEAQDCTQAIEESNLLSIAPENTMLTRPIYIVNRQTSK